ncbi:MAG: imidazoleglycerol-phosphate dehydratase HisB [Bacillota bacterium]
MRQAQVQRHTRETRVTVDLELDGSGKVQVDTGLAFLDHLLAAFALHALFDLRLTARGDLEVDGHHTVEDVGMCLGHALRRALGGGEGISRWGWCLLPMDEALVEVAVDAGGRSFLAYRVPVVPRSLGAFHTEMAPEFWRAFVRESGTTMHIHLRQGENVHHILEALWKAAGVALRQAVRIEPRLQGVPSTKGAPACKDVPTSRSVPPGAVFNLSEDGHSVPVQQAGGHGEDRGL